MVTRATLERLAALAREAGAAAMAHYGAGTTAELKADRSPVTAADRASHAVIVPALAALDPSVPVVSEEGALPTAEVRRGWWDPQIFAAFCELLHGLPPSTL